jgi:Fur family transcriptional regulator, ferric uptake regulator
MQRITRQTQAIETVIEQSHEALSPDELLIKAKGEVKNLGIATVYRYLKRGMEAGIIRAVSLAEQPLRYEWIASTSEENHYHHFYCRVCQRVLHIHACPKHLDALVPIGFTVDAHDLMLYGCCASCQSSISNS